MLYFFLNSLKEVWVDCWHDLPHDHVHGYIHGYDNITRKELQAVGMSLERNIMERTIWHTKNILTAKVEYLDDRCVPSWLLRSQCCDFALVLFCRSIRGVDFNEIHIIWKHSKELTSENVPIIFSKESLNLFMYFTVKEKYIQTLAL